MIGSKSKTASLAQPSLHGGFVSRRGILTGSLAIAATWTTHALAQSASEANEIIRSLAPIQGQAITPGYAGPRRQAVQVEETTIYVDLARSISLEVYFEFGSATITSRARVQLAALGRALTAPQLIPYRYLIAGHTDTVGSETYNLDLSRRRALAVRDYLITTFPIDPRRLLAVGFGFHHLKRPETPRAAINRRVDVLLIVP